jgi:hypothetical protein
MRPPIGQLYLWVGTIYRVRTKARTANGVTVL